MKLQRIIAKDSRTANEQAIAQYGRDVLVVSNSRVNGMTELIVAVDVEPEKMPPPQMKPGAGQMFESALQTHLAHPTPSTASMSTPVTGAAARSAVAPVDRVAAAADNPAGAASSNGGFVPAHLALMQTAQRAAAVIDAAQSGSAHAPMGRTPLMAAPQGIDRSTMPFPQSPASHPVLRYDQQYSLPALPQQAMASYSLNFGAIHATRKPAASAASPAPMTSSASSAPRTAESPEQTDPSAADLPISTPADARAAVDLIRQEIAQLRKEMRMGQQLQSWAAQGPAHRWNEALTEVGVSTTMRALLISGLSNDYNDAQALGAIEAQMLENLPGAPKAAGARGSSTRMPWRQGIHLLSGPAGSGKTSMAARLAQEAAERLGVERVVLISWNDARPGAWGQLQLWASRIGVTALRAPDSATLELLLQEHRGELIIIDSGLCQPDILLAACAELPLTHHLVMPADATAATLRRWIGAQAPAWNDLLVTRLDESAQPWPLLQACCEQGLFPAAASDGSAIHHLRLPYDARALLQHGMGLLAAGLGGQAGTEAGETHSANIEIPTIEQITTTVPPREAGRSGRSRAGAATSSRTGRGNATSTRSGASHA